MSLLTVAVTGLMAGLGHVFTGPDHLAAVAPLAIRRPRPAWLIGLSWGLGHGLGMGLLAGVALALRQLFPIDLISHWSERLVGVVLIVIGLWAVRKAIGIQLHVHEHEHDGVPHAHIHAHPAWQVHDRQSHAHIHSALGIGTLHGLAGTAHLLGVLPALLLPSGIAAVVYLVAFSAGAMAGMAGFAQVVGRLTAATAARGARPLRMLMLAGGGSAIAVGAWWVLMTLPFAN